MTEATESAMKDRPKRGRPPKTKKRPPGESPGPVEPVNPRWAQYASPAAVLGKLASRLAQNVMESGAPRNVRPRKRKKKRKKRTRKPWGQHTWRKRHLAEKRRSKYVAMLVPGMMLYREYRGIVHQVLVRERDYLHVTGNRVYPTLAAVTVAITERRRCKNGRWLCPHSAVRFWNLRNLLIGPRT